MRRERWSPTWAVYLAWAVVVTCGAFTAYLAGVIVDDLSYRGEKFDGLGATLGSLGTGILLLVVAPWVWFLVRGGKVALGAAPGEDTCTDSRPGRGGPARGRLEPWWAVRVPGRGRVGRRARAPLSRDATPPGHE